MFAIMEQLWYTKNKTEPIGTGVNATKATPGSTATDPSTIAPFTNRDTPKGTVRSNFFGFLENSRKF